MKINNRLNSISEYHFQKLDIVKNKLLSEGKEIIDLSIGDPDLKVNANIIEELIRSLKRDKFNKYPPYEGIKDLKIQIIKYYEEVHGVKLNLDEVVVLIGSKEGINNIIPAICDIGDNAIIPSPCYPVYETSCNLWGVNYHNILLKEKENYLPQIGDIPNSIIKKSKMFILNYPNNPTGAVANEKFYKEMIDFGEENDIIIVNDGAYNEIIKEGEKPISILQFDKNKSSVEFGSFSKSYNMTGFRIGYAVGNSKVIKALLKVKSNVDSGQFLPIQWAAIEALKLDRDYIRSIRKIYDERRKVAERLLTEHNIQYFKPEGAFYLWCKIPKSYAANEFFEELLKEYGIIVTPGEAFGGINFNHFRISLTTDIENIRRAFEKIETY